MLSSTRCRYNQALRNNATTCSAVSAVIATSCANGMARWDNSVAVSSFQRWLRTLGAYVPTLMANAPKYYKYPSPWLLQPMGSIGTSSPQPRQPDSHLRPHTCADYQTTGLPVTGAAMDVMAVLVRDPMTKRLSSSQLYR